MDQDDCQVIVGSEDGTFVSYDMVSGHVGRITPTKVTNTRSVDLYDKVFDPPCNTLFDTLFHTPYDKPFTPSFTTPLRHTCYQPL